MNILEFSVTLPLFRRHWSTLSVMINDRLPSSKSVVIQITTYTRHMMLNEIHVLVIIGTLFFCTDAFSLTYWYIWNKWYPKWYTISFNGGFISWVLYYIKIKKDVNTCFFTSNFEFYNKTRTQKLGIYSCHYANFVDIGYTTRCHQLRQKWYY